jgi:ketosteroid isomerase-like protein
MATPDQDLTEVVRRTMDALNRGDFSAAVELAHPEVVFVRPGGLPDVQGAKALRAWMEPDAFESQLTDIRQMETKANRVLVEQHTVARGAGSGIEMGIDSWAVWEFDEDGKVVRVQFLLHHEEDEARRALSGG